MTNEEIKKMNMSTQKVVLVTEEQVEFVLDNPTASHLNLHVVLPTATTSWPVRRTRSWSWKPSASRCI
jgi:hypothetical protein